MDCSIPWALALVRACRQDAQIDLSSFAIIAERPTDAGRTHGMASCIVIDEMRKAETERYAGLSPAQAVFHEHAPPRASCCESLPLCRFAAPGLL